jgi:hypothetical protein
MKGKAAAVFAVTLAAALAGSVPVMAASHATAPPGKVKTFGGMHVASGIHLAATHLPHLRVENGTYVSNNWAGYAITARGGKTIPQVNDYFSVPSVNCADSTIGTGGVAYVSDWAGLDGLVDTTVEQEGIDVYCTSTTSAPTYAAWYEMYPSAPVAFTGTINPGDAISVETQRSGSSYVLDFEDVTTGAGFSTTQACPSGATCRDNSAEVITEDPGGAVAGGVDLADFGMDNQTGILAHTYNGLQGSFATCDFWTQQTVDMVDPSNDAMATLSPMYGNQAFNVTWDRSG